MQGVAQAPPKPSKRDLITAMECHSIGTDATVADHIKKQLDCGYALKLQERGGLQLRCSEADSSLPGMQGVTQAPPKLSERDLITAMERHGIGTDATVADHIKKQLDRGYAIKDHAALFSPSPLGEALIASYHRMGLSNLWQPNLRFAGHVYTLSRLHSHENGMRILLILGSGLSSGFALPAGRGPHCRLSPHGPLSTSGSPISGAAHHACFPCSPHLHLLQGFSSPLTAWISGPPCAIHLVAASTCKLIMASVVSWLSWCCLRGQQSSRCAQGLSDGRSVKGLSGHLCRGIIEHNISEGRTGSPAQRGRAGRGCAALPGRLHGSCPEARLASMPPATPSTQIDECVRNA